MLRRNCGYCGKVIERWNSKRNRQVKVPFCNHKCQGEYQRGKNNHMWKGGKAKKECLICKEIYFTKIGKSENRKTCSKKCQGEWLALKTKEMRNCELCNEEFVVNRSSFQQFCSRECADLCHGLNMRGEGNPNYVDGKADRRHPYEFNNKLKRAIRLRDNYTCQICEVIEGIDYDRALDTHHIDYDKNHNEEDNLISLCNKCHSRTNGKREYWKERLSNLLNVK